ncbi:hypothetical protein [Flavobacterium sp.]|uniref:hypothetical protein n=1 Tax=Flavobacterium sp. TaxID=239 RepID=UPI003D29D3B4
MKILKKITFVLAILVSVIIILIYDRIDRNQVYSIATTNEELKTFFWHKTSEEQEKAYESNFGNEKYEFPRDKVAKIKLYKNVFLISRITSKKISESNEIKLTNFFNNPENFSWGETTWNVEEAKYILRFFDENENEIGKIWICIDGCYMSKSIPFSPNMKYGGLSKIGREKIKDLLNDY